MNENLAGDVSLSLVSFSEMQREEHEDAIEPKNENFVMSTKKETKTNDCVTYQDVSPLSFFHFERCGGTLCLLIPKMLITHSLTPNIQITH